MHPGTFAHRWTRTARLAILAAGTLGAAACAHHAPETDVDVVSAAPLPPVSDSGRELTADQQVQQALSRLSFGARPGDVARVRHMGIDRWIAEQLTPASVHDLPAQAFLAHFPTYSLSIQTLVASYPEPAQVRRMLKTGEVADTVALRQVRDSLRRAQGRILADVDGARVARAVMSERQLDEVMTDFWENHFNVYANKGGPERYYLADFDRSVIRPHALGRFRDLLGAVAHSPAMLFYLDNWESVADSNHETLTPQTARGRTARRARGLNENYGRELLELHTLGVDGGYTQDDVINVARAFTGWSIQRADGNMQPAGSFVFRPAAHDADPKVVLGHTLAGGRGLADGEDVLDIVARHPATARTIARALCVRFVSDEPPPALVDRAAGTFARTDGDIRQVVWTIVTSPEFFSRAAYRSKVKTPFEIVVSALRALGATPDSTDRTAQVVARLGEPIFGHQAPNGYAETGESWMNTGAILSRINFGMAIAADRIPGVRVSAWPPAATLATATRTDQVDGVVAALLGGDASPDTRRILLSGNHPFLAAARADSSAARLGGAAGRPDPMGLAEIVGLAIGAPEFQRR
jgi:uncharacterized protein (DUF1800 family)